MDVLSDREGLASLPPDSFGSTYAAFMSAENLSAQGLADAQATGRRVDPDQSPEHRWFFDRLRDMHDLWHVLTGYGRDLPGEAALLAFSYAQTKNRAIGLIVLTAAVRGPKTLDCHWQRTLFRAWRRGRRAALLPMARFEELLPRPLEEARRALHIDPIERAHPGGFPGSEASAAAA
jgi:ubiquinone biosynthesis protein COQ4